MALQVKAERMEFYTVPSEAEIKGYEIRYVDLAQAGIGSRTEVSPLGGRGSDRLIARGECTGLGDSWEGENQNAANLTWVDVIFPTPGQIVGFSIDTRGVEDAELAIYEAPNVQITGESISGGQILITNPMDMKLESKNFFAGELTREVFRSVRLTILNSGRVGRFRVYGVVARPEITENLINVLEPRLGARVIACSHWGTPWELLGEGGGWITKRRRGEQEEYVRIELGLPALINYVEIDTTGFEGTCPKAFQVYSINGETWTRILESNLRRGNYRYEVDLQGDLYSQLMFVFLMGGGVARLRAYGRFGDQDQDQEHGYYENGIQLRRNRLGLEEQYLAPNLNLDLNLDDPRSTQLARFVLAYLLLAHHLPAERPNRNALAELVAFWNVNSRERFHQLDAMLGQVVGAMANTEMNQAAQRNEFNFPIPLQAARETLTDNQQLYLTSILNALPQNQLPDYAENIAGANQLLARLLRVFIPLEESLDLPPNPLEGIDAVPEQTATNILYVLNQHRRNLQVEAPDFFNAFAPNAPNLPIPFPLYVLDIQDQ